MWERTCEIWYEVSRSDFHLAGLPKCAVDKGVQYNDELHRNLQERLEERSLLR